MEILESEIPIILVEDVAIGLEEESSKSFIEALSNKSTWRYNYLGFYKNKYVFQLSIYPYSLLPMKNQLEWVGQLRLRFSGEGIQLTIQT